MGMDCRTGPHKNNEQFVPMDIFEFIYFLDICLPKKNLFTVHKKGRFLIATEVVFVLFET